MKKRRGMYSERKTSNKTRIAPFLKLIHFLCDGRFFRGGTKGALCRGVVQNYDASIYAPKSCLIMNV
ncbi:hypothetical protein GCK32_017561 [Trichostrongylus colubriformis]|uniref:Uncharacterized protein n=1 Tax=Trichostrongylus colubriformis TaxID=6319 RepID=A0AAN8IE49_TRICO